jgi:gamma-glutamyltranspeptidase / glutathione hydrolase
MKTTGVIACPEPLAAEAGAEILRNGGNAADAAVATALAQGVASPLMCGVGGGGSLVYHDAQSGQATHISALGYAPSRATPTMWAEKYAGRNGSTWQLTDKANLIGYQAQLVPGLLRGLGELHRRFGSGRLSWADLFAPAIRLAEEGYPVPEWLWDMWRPGGRVGAASGFRDPLPFLSTNRAAAAVFAPEGTAIGPGERLVQKDYANTLGRIATEGADVFFTGEIAHAIAEDFAKNDGLITYEDLRDFRVSVMPPVRSTYRQYGVFGTRAPGLGPIIVEILNILEGYDLASLGWNTPAYLDLLSRAMQLGFADRLRYFADPAVFDVPVDRLVSKEHAARLRALIDSGKDVEAVAEAKPGSEGTTALTVLDGEGNAIVLIHSINTGAGVMTPGLGFLHNSHMWMFNPLPGHRNSIAPRRVPISGSSGAIFTSDGAPTLLVASPGGARGTTGCIQAALNVFEFGMDVGRAVSVGRIHSEDEPGVLVLDEGIPPETDAALESLGRTVQRGPYGGRVSACRRDPTTGTLSGGSDPRGGAGLAVVD